MIPEKINLYGMEITTKYSDTLITDDDADGMYCARNMTIILDTHLSEQKKAYIYCHELVEAIISINMLDIEDEEVKQSLALGFFQILNQRPDLLGGNKS